MSDNTQQYGSVMVGLVPQSSSRTTAPADISVASISLTGKQVNPQTSSPNDQITELINKAQQIPGAKNDQLREMYYERLETLVAEMEREGFASEVIEKYIDYLDSQFNSNLLAVI